MEPQRSALSEQTLERLLAAAPDPVVAIDAAGVVRFASEALAQLLGFSPTDLAGRPFDVLVPGWVHRPGPDGGRASARHRDGRAVEVELSLVPMDPHLTGVFVQDLTARLALEAENDRLRDELIGNISHELQTPLTSIIGYSELLRDLGDDELGPQARRLVDIVHRNAQRELRLVEDLLAVSFPGEHLARRADDTVDLVAVAERVVEERRAFAQGAGLELTHRGDGPAQVRGDEQHLARLVEHLVVNGCKFSPPGGRVAVEVTTDATSVLLTVVDTGIGISEEEGDRLFERLYRPPGAIARPVDGAGLGLAVAKAVTEAHGGTIELDSTLDVGTTVRVRLPRSG